MSLDEAIDAKIDRTSKPGCWLWTGCAQNDLPVLFFNKQRLTPRKYVYQKTHGSYHGYLTTSCGHPRCLNPAHICPNSNTTRKRPSLELFWGYVVRPTDLDACWGWTGPDRGNGQGYGCFGGSMYPAHRFSYELHHGPIVDGLFVCHRCDNPPCCNPKHLFLGTAQENVVDCQQKGRLRRPHGSRHHKAKLTEAQVAELRQAYANGTETHKALGARYGVKTVTISAILSRRNWRHI